LWHTIARCLSRSSTWYVSPSRPPFLPPNNCTCISEEDSAAQRLSYITPSCPAAIFQPHLSCCHCITLTLVKRCSWTPYRYLILTDGLLLTRPLPPEEHDQVPSCRCPTLKDTVIRLRLVVVLFFSNDEVSSVRIPTCMEAGLSPTRLLPRP
jgi:hypothetical protein